MCYTYCASSIIAEVWSAKAFINVKLTVAACVAIDASAGMPIHNILHAVKCCKNNVGMRVMRN